MSVWRRMFWLAREIPILMGAWEAARPRLAPLAQADPSVRLLYDRCERIWRVVRRGERPKDL